MPTKEELVKWDKRAAMLCRIRYDENAWMRRNKAAVIEKHRRLTRLLEMSIGMSKIPGWDKRLKAHLAICPALDSLALPLTA